MLTLPAIATALHALAAVIWVGGMFFAYMILRPSLSDLEPPQRLTLWNNVFARFFFWVWLIVIALPATGYFLLFAVYNGFAAAAPHIHIMHLLGLIMIGLFVFLYLAPYRKFRTAVTASQWPLAAGHLATIRKTVAMNMVLGLVTVWEFISQFPRSFWEIHFFR